MHTVDEGGIQSEEKITDEFETQTSWSFWDDKLFISCTQTSVKKNLSDQV